MQPDDPLRRALVALSAGEQPAEELPDLAADALARGLDSPALRELAGARQQDYDENRRLFSEAMRELGVDAPAVDAALRDLVTFWAKEIVDGTVDPYAGASHIWRRAWWQLGGPSDLAIFVGLASEWEDHPDDRSAIEEQIVTEARRLVEGQ